jgi:BirA family biotin operon repressor/biotin-[acetyl-CoA-carboxylase] ligase
MPLVTLTVALAIVKALQDIHVEKVSIKWPNDVYIGRGKVAGILTEMHLEDDKVGYAVVGLGINVNLSHDELPDGAASVSLALKREIDLADLSHIIIKNLDRLYADLLGGRTRDLLEMIKESSGLILGERFASSVPKTPWKGMRRISTRAAVL